MMSNLFCLVTLSGTPTAVTFLEAVKQEAAKRAAQKIAVIPNERIRLAWDVIPMWYNMAFFNKLEEEGVVFVFEMYNAPGFVWGGRLDPDNPIESLAAKYLAYPWNVLDPRTETIKKVFEWHIDGWVAHIIRSCNELSMGSTQFARIMHNYGVPTLLLNSDHCDPRQWNEEQMMQRVHAFLEMIANNPKRT
jgi:benzoyl-CoA reductase/2-hydroxyglutaryl-CoA dehydratase subunit BcrC/BadD/HgdB